MTSQDHSRVQIHATETKVEDCHWNPSPSNELCKCIWKSHGVYTDLANGSFLTMTNLSHTKQVLTIGQTWGLNIRTEVTLQISRRVYNVEG